MVASRDGSRRRRIVRLPFAEPLSEPVWAPDGHALAFARGILEGCRVAGRTCTDLYRMGIYVVRANGTGLRRVAQMNAPVLPPDHYAPAWSPDGRHLAFAWTNGVFVTDATCGKPRRLARKGRESAVAWAPSSRIVFADQGTIYTVRPGERPVPIRG